ncbi:MAG TPA: hypothetical protein VGP55_16055 [Chitinophagaceae bacterium]|nr:hypothetical protein [Chitinophagaceae bacterium]
MIPELRKQFNENFTQKKYEDFLLDLNSKHPGDIVFRIAETPIFIPKDFTDKMLDACEAIVDFIVRPDFKKLTSHAIPEGENVPDENDHTHFIAFDFGICENENGNFEPQLIEMQGFPTLFAFQVMYPQVVEKHFNIPKNFDHYLSGYNAESYTALLKKIIIGDHKVENVILLEIKPHEQKTRIDFYCTQDYLDIPIVCLTELEKEGKNLFYKKDGKRIEIKRIYNRIIFDELIHIKKDLGNVVDITESFDVEWVPHPNWFYRISKFTLPFINHPFVPETFFLNEVKQLPGDLENYVLKPLFSFAGQGVIIDVTKEDIDAVTNPENWILQRKVKYADVIKTPNVPAKAEARIFYFWEDGAPRPVAVNNLARISKGKMIGVRYNMDKDWVGGSVCYFEKG